MGIQFPPIAFLYLLYLFIVYYSCTVLKSIIKLKLLSLMRILYDFWSAASLLAVLDFKVPHDISSIVQADLTLHSKPPVVVTVAVGVVDSSSGNKLEC